MAEFVDHINQAKTNLLFLEKINSMCPEHCDWQVTVCFYASLHLVNAHLSKYSLQYRKHKDVKHILNPKTLSIPKLPEDEYVAYVALQSLSRRARYLVNEKDGQLSSTQAFLTYDKHLLKAIRHLNKLIHYFNDKYSLALVPIKLNCPGLAYNELHFIIPRI